MERIAYLITFGTYGARLHGDPRGSWQPRDPRFDGGQLRRDDLRAAFERRRLKSAPVRITAEGRSAIEEAICEASHYREWLLLALNVRTQHVHAVVAAHEPPEAVLHTFKAYATRRLRERQLIGNGRYWARRGSTRYLFESGSAEAAIDYVLNRQGQRLEGSRWLPPCPEA